MQEDELPLTLPSTQDFKPSGRSESPLAKITDWVQTTDPATGKAPAMSLSNSWLSMSCKVAYDVTRPADTSVSQPESCLADGLMVCTHFKPDHRCCSRPEICSRQISSPSLETQQQLQCRLAVWLAEPACKSGRIFG